MGIKVSKSDRKRLRSAEDNIDKWGSNEAITQTHQNLTNEIYGNKRQKLSDQGQGPPQSFRTQKALRNIQQLRNQKDKRQTQSPLITTGTSKFLTPQLSSQSSQRRFQKDKNSLDQLYKKHTGWQTGEETKLAVTGQPESSQQQVDLISQKRNKLLESLGVASQSSFNRVPVKRPPHFAHLGAPKDRLDCFSSNGYKSDDKSQDWSSKSRTMSSNDSPRVQSKIKNIFQRKTSFDDKTKQQQIECQNCMKKSFGGSEEQLLEQDSLLSAKESPSKTNVFNQTITTNYPEDLKSFDSPMMRSTDTQAQEFGQPSQLTKQFSNCSCSCSQSSGSNESPDMFSNSDNLSIGKSSNNQQIRISLKNQKEVPNGWHYLNDKQQFEQSPVRNFEEDYQQPLAQNNIFSPYKAQRESLFHTCSLGLNEESKTHQKSKQICSKTIRMRYLSKLTYHQVWLAPNQQPRSHQNLTIFDWDDTLLPTTFLLDSSAQESELEQIAVIHRKVLVQIQNEVLLLLEKFLRFGKVLIITNARKGWVEYSSGYLLPRVHRLIKSQIPVISARSDFEGMYPKDISAWKDSSFQTLWDVDSLLIKDCLLNLMVIGDSKYEIEAGKKFKKSCKSKCVLKLMKLKEDPNPLELTKQLSVLNNQFQFITSSCKPLNLIIQSQ